MRYRATQSRTSSAILGTDDGFRVLDPELDPGADAFLHCPQAFVDAAALRRSNFNKAIKWKQAAAAIGVPELHLHDPRHTGNTLAAGTPGASTRDLMERMGHDTMRAAPPTTPYRR